MWVPASIPFTIAVLVAAYRFVEPRRTDSTLRDLRPREITYVSLETKLSEAGAATRYWSKVALLESVPGGHDGAMV